MDVRVNGALFSAKHGNCNLQCTLTWIFVLERHGHILFSVVDYLSVHDKIKFLPECLFCLFKKYCTMAVTWPLKVKVTFHMVDYVDGNVKIDSNNIETPNS